MNSIFLCPLFVNKIKQKKRTIKKQKNKIYTVEKSVQYQLISIYWVIMWKKAILLTLLNYTVKEKKKKHSISRKSSTMPLTVISSASSYLLLKINRFHGPEASLADLSSVTFITRTRVLSLLHKLRNMFIYLILWFTLHWPVPSLSLHVQDFSDNSQWYWIWLVRSILCLPLLC